MAFIPKTVYNKLTHQDLHTARSYELCRKYLGFGLLAIPPRSSFGQLLCLIPEVWYDYQTWAHLWGGHRADQQDSAQGGKLAEAELAPQIHVILEAAFSGLPKASLFYLPSLPWTYQYLSINPPFLLRLAKDNFCCSNQREIDPASGVEVEVVPLMVTLQISSPCHLHYRLLLFKKL